MGVEVWNRVFCACLAVKHLSEILCLHPPAADKSRNAELWQSVTGMRMVRKRTARDGRAARRVTITHATTRPRETGKDSPPPRKGVGPSPFAPRPPRPVATGWVGP